MSKLFATIADYEEAYYDEPSYEDENYDESYLFEDENVITKDYEAACIVSGQHEPKDSWEDDIPVENSQSIHFLSILHTNIMIDQQKLKKTGKTDKQKLDVVESWCKEMDIEVTEIPGSLDEQYDEVMSQRHIQLQQIMSSFPENFAKEEKPKKQTVYVNKERAFGGKKEPTLNVNGKLQGKKKMVVNVLGRRKARREKSKEIIVIPRSENGYQEIYNVMDQDDGESSDNEDVPLVLPDKEQVKFDEPIKPKVKVEHTVTIVQLPIKMLMPKPVVDAKPVEKMEETEEQKAGWEKVTRHRPISKVKEHSEQKPEREKPEREKPEREKPEREKPEREKPKKPMKTRLCFSVTTNRSCPHGDSCTFAHSFDELAHVPCNFAQRCLFTEQITDGKYNNKGGQKVCSFWHPNESVASYAKRLGLPYKEISSSLTTARVNKPAPIAPWAKKV